VGNFSLAIHFKDFLRWTCLVSTFIGREEAILTAFCTSVLRQIYQTLYLSFGCRNAGLHFLRMQEWYCSPWGMGYLLICFRLSDPTKGISCSLYQHNPAALFTQANHHLGSKIYNGHMRMTKTRSSSITTQVRIWLFGFNLYFGFGLVFLK
jgi:hypothetical protein